MSFFCCCMEPISYDELIPDKPHTNESVVISKDGINTIIPIYQDKFTSVYRRINHNTYLLSFFSKENRLQILIILRYECNSYTLIRGIVFMNGKDYEIVEYNR